MTMYLLDTDVISEARKESRADVGVRAFFSEVQKDDAPLYLSVITIGELRRGVERVRHRGDRAQATRLEQWLKRITGDFAGSILPFDEDAAQVWGRLRVPNAENWLDKQIAATALIHDLTVVTRNTAHFESTGTKVRNPFRGVSAAN
jgi:predicted nucleic acid-binding protein